jgi:hypothetical protein
MPAIASKRYAITASATRIDANFGWNFGPHFDANFYAN